mgnify:CR=1 FL=1
MKKAALRIAFLLVFGLGWSVVVSDEACASEPPVECFLSVRNRYPGVSSRTWAKLCAGATTLAPVDCYADAVNRIRDAQVDYARLCSKASSNAPVSCYLEARGIPAMLVDDAVQLCTNGGIGS